MRLFLSTVLLILLVEYTIAYRNLIPLRRYSNSFKLQMIELEANTATYVGMFIATMVPSLALG